MKEYKSLGQLLIDYRVEYDLSQTDLAYDFNTDIPTIQSWENDETLIGQDKEKEIAEITMLPYQLIRNLNSTHPIPTFYDFRIRKYALTEWNKRLPEANWLKERMHELSDRVRTINPEKDIEVLHKDLRLQKYYVDPPSAELIKKGVELLPELNLIITDRFQFYSGHSIWFPISQLCYRKLINREMEMDEIELVDVVNYKKLEKPIFLNYDITADCNDNIFYLVHEIFNFFSNFPQKDYVIISYTSRYDNFDIYEQIGHEIVWEEETERNALGKDYYPRLYRGNLHSFLAGNPSQGYEQF